MLSISGKILDGEQLLLVFKKKGNPPVEVGDIVKLNKRKFEVQRLETARGMVSAEVSEFRTRDRDINTEVADWLVNRYVVHLNFTQMRDAAF
jgi:phage-related protein